MANFKGYITVKDEEGIDRDIKLVDVLWDVPITEIVRELGEDSLLYKISVREVVAYYDKQEVMNELTKLN